MGMSTEQAGQLYLPNAEVGLIEVSKPIWSTLQHIFPLVIDRLQKVEAQPQFQTFFRDYYGRQHNQFLQFLHRTPWLPCRLDNAFFVTVTSNLFQAEIKQFRSLFVAKVAYFQLPNKGHAFELAMQRLGVQGHLNGRLLVGFVSWLASQPGDVVFSIGQMAELVKELYNLPEEDVFMLRELAERDMPFIWLPDPQSTPSTEQSETERMEENQMSSSINEETVGRMYPLSRFVRMDPLLHVVDTAGDRTRVLPPPLQNSELYMTKVCDYCKKVQGVHGASGLPASVRARQCTCKRSRLAELLPHRPGLVKTLPNLMDMVDVLLVLKDRIMQKTEGSKASVISYKHVISFISHLIENT